MTLPGNESCDRPIIGGGNQTDLNAPVVPGTTPPDVGPGSPNTGSDGFLQLHNLQTIQELCCDGMSPNLMTGTVMLLLANHFANPNLIMTPALKKYVYVPPTTGNGLTTKISIMTNTAFNPLTSPILPALVVKRLAIQSERRSIGDKLDAGMNGESRYVRFVTGGVRVMVLAANAGENEALALEVYDTLTFLAPIMVERMQFMDFQVMSVGELGVLEELGNKLAIPIDIQMTFEYAWGIKPLAPRLKTLSISVP